MDINKLKEGNKLIAMRDATTCIKENIREVFKNSEFVSQFNLVQSELIIKISELENEYMRKFDEL